MTVAQLIEELKKLPPLTQQQDVRVRLHSEAHDVDDVRWEASYVALEVR